MSGDAALDQERQEAVWPSLSDEQLVALCQEGQTAAFEVLVRRYERRLFNYLRRMTGSASDAEDLFQETFLRVYTHLERFRESGLFRAWVYRIATNVCRDLLRRRKRRPETSLDGAVRHDGAPLVDRIASPAANPRDRAREAELAGRLADAVARLSVKHRAVFLMARYDGLPYEEIGRALRIPVGTVKSRMNKAVHLLMNALEEAVE